jgi:hypothetical protein
MNDRPTSPRQQEGQGEYRQSNDDVKKNPTCFWPHTLPPCYSKGGFELLIDGMELRTMMRRAGLLTLTDDDPEKREMSGTARPYIGHRDRVGLT